jgi:choline-sulfatase
MTPPANLIFFQSDNHTRSALGCYGHPVAQTPVLDRLATLGTRFASAYSGSPLCCPARACIATGCFPHQTGYWDNIHAYDGARPSWMRRLRDAGQTVTAIGKLHYRTAGADHGFSEEIIPMHIVEGRGQVSSLLRWCGEEPPMLAQRDVYLTEIGVGTSEYQQYDAKVTQRAIEWLRENARQDRPWTLLVSYTSPHPPFRVPARFADLYSPERMPLPPQFRDGERSVHPVDEIHRASKNYVDMWDEHHIRRIAAGYFGLISFLDDQIGQVMAAAEELDLLRGTRVLYSSDHGEMLGAKGLFGKSCLYEDSLGVPLVLAGPGVPAGTTAAQPVSHVDLFPTILDGAGVALASDDRDLPGKSLWPAIGGSTAHREIFAEYHAAGSTSGSFMLRDGDRKLIYHVGAQPQLFDLRKDPDEARDISGTDATEVARLVEKLRAICDPEEVDGRAKRDQQAMTEKFGGTEAIKKAGVFRRSPPPGQQPDYRVNAGA